MYNPPVKVGDDICSGFCFSADIHKYTRIHIRTEPPNALLMPSTMSE